MGRSYSLDLRRRVVARVADSQSRRGAAEDLAVSPLLQLAGIGNADCCATKEITLRHLADVRGKIASLKKLERALKNMTDACEPSRQLSCPIIDALFASS